jgi:hypothetical protein
LNANAEQTTVGFELGFARAAQADAALLPLQVGPAANQSRRQMFELSQFDLQLALRTLRSLRKDIENQTGAVDDATLHQALQVTFLSGAQLVIENDQVGLVCGHLGRNLLDLALAGIGGRIRAVPTPVHHGTDLGTRRSGQETNFFELFGNLFPIRSRAGQ